MTKKRKMKLGFTLIEILVVLAILGLLMTFAVPSILGKVDEARVAKAKNDILTFGTALDMYRLESGFYPTTEQGLEALVKKPEVEPIPSSWQPGGYLSNLTEVPLDPWGQKFIYRSPSDVEGRNYEIISLGADKKEGGEGINADIKSFEINKTR